MGEIIFQVSLACYSLCSLGAGSMLPLVIAVFLVLGMFFGPEKLFNYFSLNRRVNGTIQP